MRSCLQTCRAIMDILPDGPGKTELSDFVTKAFLDLPTGSDGELWTQGRLILCRHYNTTDQADLRGKIAAIWHEDLTPQSGSAPDGYHWRARAEEFAASRKEACERVHELELTLDAFGGEVRVLRAMLGECEVAMEVQGSESFTDLRARLRGVLDEDGKNG